MTNKDHTPSQFRSQDWCWSKAVPNHLKSRRDAHSLSILGTKYVLFDQNLKSKSEETAYHEITILKRHLPLGSGTDRNSFPWFITTLCISDETRRIYWSNFARFIDPDSSRAPPNRKTAIKLAQIRAKRKLGNLGKGNLDPARTESNTQGPAVFI